MAPDLERLRKQLDLDGVEPEHRRKAATLRPAESSGSIGDVFDEIPSLVGMGPSEDAPSLELSENDIHRGGASRKWYPQYQRSVLLDREDRPVLDQIEIDPEQGYDLGPGIEQGVADYEPAGRDDQGIYRGLD